MQTESDHRIANTLTMLSGMLQVQARDFGKRDTLLDPSSVRNALIEASSQIAAAGELHRLLTQSRDATIDLRTYLPKVARTTIEALSDGCTIDFRFNAGGHCRVPSSLALKLGMMTDELIINALKYAHPAKLGYARIELGCQAFADGTIEVCVTDDGVGLTEGFDLARDGGIGMRMLQSLLARLGGEIAFESSDVGLTVRLSVPGAPACERAA